MQLQAQNFQFKIYTYVDPAGITEEQFQLQIQNMANPDPALTNVIVMFVSDGVNVLPPSYDPVLATVTCYKHLNEAFILSTQINLALMSNSSNRSDYINYDDVANRIDFIFGGKA
jgi:hypothetical protein